MSGTWKVPVILVDFSDQRLVYSTPAEWDRALFDTTGATPTGSVFDYYRWVSGNRFRVVGKVVAVVHLDSTKAYYGYNSWGLSNTFPRNSPGLAEEVVRRCDSQVDWSEFDRDLDGYVDMVWVLHSGLGGENTVSRENLWSITSKLSAWTGGGSYQTSDNLPGTSLKERVDAFTILPELSAFHQGSRAEIGVFCHEFGHALGLPDFYDTAPISAIQNVGPGNWSLMSTGVYGTDGLSPEYPSHLGAWPTTFLGWKTPVRPDRDSLMTLGPLESGGDILELWFQGESNHEHFLVENRQRLGFDRNLPSEGVIVYQVDDVIIRGGIPSNRVNNGPYMGLRVIEADGRHDLVDGINRGDAFDPMPGSAGVVRWDDDTQPNSRSVFGNVTHVGLQDVTAVGDDMRLMVQVRAPGWQPPRSVVGAGFQPVEGVHHGARAVQLDDGSIALASSELVSGTPQVLLRTRKADGTWAPPIAVSQSSAGATEPSLCALPGGDLCLVWSDSRHGAPELYYRSRIRGVWTPERRLTDLPGFSRGPCLGTDGRGQLHLTWLYNDAAGVHLEFMRFTYLSPFGDPQSVTASGSIPDLPSLAMAPDGSSYLLWADRSTNPTSLWYSHFSPDSGLRPPQRIVPQQSGMLPAVAGVVDRGGTLHLAWALSGVGGSELRYQQRGSRTSPDTAIVSRGEPIQDFSLASDSGGGLHLVMEAAVGGSTQILYKEWRADGGWDIGSTEVTLRQDGGAVRPSLLAQPDGPLVVLYNGYVNGVASLLERTRYVWLQPLTAVGDAPPMDRATWAVSPNPLRPGKTLTLFGADPVRGPAALEVYDLAGRRVASVPARPRVGGWRAEIEGTETRSWPSGVYFARLDGSTTRARIVVLR